MKATEFKTGLKALKANLKGITLQFITKGSVKPYSNLREFGNAVLVQESCGNDFYVNQAWTTSGIVKVHTIAQLIRLFSEQTITAIQFESFYQPSDFSDYLKNSFGTTE
jgi:hypothetical protein